MAIGRVEDGKVVVDEKEMKIGHGEKRNKPGPLNKAAAGGLGVNRRYWFTSQGIRISNLFVR